MRSGARAFVAAIAAGLLALAPAHADWTLVEEHFYALSLAGKPCGRTSERVEKDGDRVRTSSRIEMRFTRIGQETTIDLSSEFIETARGDAVEATVRQKGAEPVRFVFETQRKVRVERGAVRESRELPDESWLTPREVAAFVAARRTANAAEIRFRALDVQSGFVLADVDMKRIGSEVRQVDGHAATLDRFEVRNSIQPIVARELYAADGVLIESATPIGLGELLSRHVPRAEADASYAGAGFDLLAGTFVATKPIARWSDRRSLEVLVEAKAGDLIDLPAVGAQRFERVSPSTGKVVVDIDRGSGPEESDGTDPRWTRPNELIDSDSDAVRGLLASAKPAKGASDYERAEKLRALVSRHLSAKNLATAFGSASEAARSRSGDCTEHAVLLAALLRAEGIPSRVVSGLVYVPDLAGQGPGWGWHLWTQALVQQPVLAGGFGRAWVDFDATVSGAGRGFHAAHIAVSTSDLAGGASDPAFTRALSLIGGVRIVEAGK